MKHRAVLAGVFAGMWILASGIAQSAEWRPAGTLTLQIGFGAGGETDTLGRVIASVMKKQTGWNVVAINKPGGGGVAMFSGIAAAPADGSIIGLGVNMPIMINLILRGDKLPFNLDSFDYLATVTRAQLALIAKKDAPFNDIDGLVAYSKSTGGAAVAFDSKTTQSIFQLIDKQTGAGLKIISTKSSAEMLQYVLGGQVMAAFSAGIHVPYMKTGRIKMLASANDGRHNYAPDIPSLKEQGYNFFVDPYFYFAAPKGLPADTRAALENALDKAINSAKVKKVVANALKSEVSNLGPAGTKKMLVDGIAGVKVLFGK